MLRDIFAYLKSSFLLMIEQIRISLVKKNAYWIY